MASKHFTAARDEETARPRGAEKRVVECPILFLGSTFKARPLCLPDIFLFVSVFKIVRHAWHILTTPPPRTRAYRADNERCHELTLAAHFSFPSSPASEAQKLLSADADVQPAAKTRHADARTAKLLARHTQKCRRAPRPGHARPASKRLTVRKQFLASRHYTYWLFRDWPISTGHISYRRAVSAARTALVYLSGRQRDAMRVVESLAL